MLGDKPEDQEKKKDRLKKEGEKRAKDKFWYTSSFDIFVINHNVEEEKKRIEEDLRKR